MPLCIFRAVLSGTVKAHVASCNRGSIRCMWIPLCYKAADQQNSVGSCMLQSRAALGCTGLGRTGRSLMAAMGTSPTAATAVRQTELSWGPDQKFSFGPHTILGSEVFAVTAHSYAFVNLKPVVPGHVLVSPQKVHKRFADLSPEEVSDLWMLVQRVGVAVEAIYEAQSLTLAIQDGPQAGQTVPHVHVHVLPRRAQDFARNDDVYDAIDANARLMKDALQDGSVLPKDVGEKLHLDAARKVRTPEEMAQEACELRKCMSDFKMLEFLLNY